MAWAHRTDGIEGVEGWIDAPLAQAWARDAMAHFEASRTATTLADSKTHLRSALVSLDNATAALNLPQSQGSGDLLTQPFPFGLDRVELDASPAAKSAAQAAAVARFGSDGLRDWAMAQPVGRYWLPGFNVRVFVGLDGEKSYSVQAPDTEVLANRRTQPATESERRALAIVADPWAAYVARRKYIDATNARYAGYWGLTTPEQIAGFQVAADAVNQAMGAEWDARQRAAVKAKADEILDRIATYAAATGVGAPLAAVMQAVKLLTGVLPWVTEAQPPPALARQRTGGVSDRASDRPTHRVPSLLSSPVEAVMVATGTLTGSVSTPSAKAPGVGVGRLGLPNLSPGAVRSMLGEPAVSGSSRIETGTTGGGAVASSSSSSSTDTGLVVLVLGAGGLLYLLTR